MRVHRLAPALAQDRQPRPSPRQGGSSSGAMCGVGTVSPCQHWRGQGQPRLLSPVAPQQPSTGRWAQLSSISPQVSSRWPSHPPGPQPLLVPTSPSQGAPWVQRGPTTFKACCRPRDAPGLPLQSPRRMGCWGPLWCLLPVRSFIRFPSTEQAPKLVAAGHALGTLQRWVLGTGLMQPLETAVVQHAARQHGRGSCAGFIP